MGRTEVLWKSVEVVMVTILGVMVALVFGHFLGHLAADVGDAALEVAHTGLESVLANDLL